MLIFGDSRLQKYWDSPSRVFWAGMDLMHCGDSAREYPYPSRHGRNYNVLFADGHVSGMKPATLFNPTNSARMWNRDHEPHPESW